jgi:hypothetical protein
LKSLDHGFAKSTAGPLQLIDFKRLSKMTEPRVTMRTMAQYKVVDEIAAGFKMAIWDFSDYMDMWIAFPKRRTKPRR